MVNIVSGGNNNNLKINTNIGGPSGNYGTTIEARNNSNKNLVRAKYSNNEVEEYDFSKNNLYGPRNGTDPLGNSNRKTLQSSSNVINQSGSNVINQSGSNVINQSSSNVINQSSSNVINQSSSNVINQSSSNVINQSGSNVINQSGSNATLPIGTNTESKYSNTEHSDMDNININQLRTIMVNLKNILNDAGPSYYKYFCEYCEGKKLSDIIDENGCIKPINAATNDNSKNNSSDYMIAINYGINEALKGLPSDSRITGLSDEMLNSTIEEIVFSEDGYDAFVLKHPNGNYMIVNSSTNSESIEDLAAILYSLILNIFGDTELLDFLFDSIVVNMDIDGLSADKFFTIIKNEGGIGAYCRKIYNNQISDCASLINKYNSTAGKEGQQLELYGFSLGGGIMAAAYQEIVDKSFNHNNINNVTLYNPFMLLAQERSILEDDFLKLVDDDKFLIYSAQQDFVSLFYDHVEDFLDKTVYVNAGELKPINIEEFNFKEIFELIIGPSGNHGFINIEKNSFDQSGNIRNEANFVGINDWIVSVIEENYSFDGGILDGLLDVGVNIKFGDKYCVDKEFLISSILDINNLNSFLGQNASYTNDIIDDVCDYFVENYGNYNYTGLSDSLATSITKVIYNITDDTIYEYIYPVVDSCYSWVPFVSDEDIKEIASNGAKTIYNLLMGFFDGDRFRNAIKETLEEKKELVELIISLRICNNKEDYNKEVNNLIICLKQTYSRLLNDAEINTTGAGKNDLVYVFFDRLFTEMIIDTLEEKLLMK